MSTPEASIPSEIPVLIVGGGPVGLTASILLSRFGVPSLLVERHPGTSVHPKARAINARTMEMYRQCGVEAAIRAAGLHPDKARFIIWTSSLAGDELERRVPWRSRPEAMEVSPLRTCICAQDDLEPVLRVEAESAGHGALRFDTDLIGFEPDGDHLVATLRHRGTDTRVRARYVIGADGARSRVREALGIPMHGTAALYRSINVLLHADLTPWVAGRPAALYFVEQPGLRATFLTINGVNRWGFLINNVPVSTSPEEYTAERCAAIVRQAVGMLDLDVEILGIAPWVAAAQVAERYRDGGVFIAGDAAHHMPPTGGFGLNTGVQDVHNLAWKLAAVLHGWGAAALLDSYEAERLPYGRAITEQALMNSLSLGRTASPDATPPPVGTTLARPEFLNEMGMIFGASYESTAVVPDGTPAVKVANPVTDYVPTARPGARAPHVWVARDGERVSTIDLFGPWFTLLAGAAGAPWCDAARAVAGASAIPLEAFTIGPAGQVRDPERRWADVYGVEQDGAVLVRPDGHVAWRSSSSSGNSAVDLTRVFASVLGDPASRTARTAAAPR